MNPLIVYGLSGVVVAVVIGIVIYALVRQYRANEAAKRKREERRQADAAAKLIVREKNRAGYRKGGSAGSHSIIIGVDNVDESPAVNLSQRKGLEEIKETFEPAKENDGKHEQNQDIELTAGPKQTEPNMSIQ